MTERLACGGRCRPGRGALGVVAAVAALLVGCTVLPQNSYQPPRYFRPELPGLPAAETPPGESALPLYLRPVTAAGHLRERIVWRTSDVEMGFYDLRRWTDLPAEYVEGALEGSLFESGRMRRVAGGHGPSLDVEVRAFDEVLRPVHEVRISLYAQLRDPNHNSLMERAFRVERPVHGDDPTEMARTMGEALQQISEDVAQAVVGVLKRTGAGGGRGPGR